MTVELRSRQAAAAIHAAVAQVEPRALPTRRRFFGRRGLMALIIAVSTPPVGVALVNAIRGDDPQTNQRIVDDQQRVEDDDGNRVLPDDRGLEDAPARVSGSKDASTGDVEPGGGEKTPAARSATTSALTGRLAFTATDKPVDHWANECGGGPCVYYNPSDVHTIDLRTGRTTPLAASPLFEQGSAWSPDGSRLAYSVARGDTTAALHTIGANGRDNRQIVSIEGKLALEPTWSPDGRRIAFALQNHATPYGMTCCPEIWMVDVDGNNLHRVDEITNTDSAPSNPAWSPDGRYLAFERIDVPTDPYEQAETWIFDLETRGLKYFADGAEPAWSPDGKRMAVASLGTGGEFNGAVVVFDVASGDAIDFISRPDSNLAEPAWSPDGKWVAFTSRGSASGSMRSIWVARSNGESVSAIVDGDKDYWAPSWVR